MLMDLFYKRAAVTRKKRVHFNSFMLDIHDSMYCKPSICLSLSLFYPTSLSSLPPSFPFFLPPFLSLPFFMQGFTNSRRACLDRQIMINPMHTTPLLQWPEMWLQIVTFCVLMSSRYVNSALHSKPLYNKGRYCGTCIY